VSRFAVGTITGTIDVSDGVVSNPLLQVSPYPGETFSSLLSILHLTFSIANEWHI
jgi:hypothetical protein